MKRIFLFLIVSQMALASAMLRDPKKDLLIALRQSVGPNVRVEIARLFVSGHVPADAKLVLNESSALGPIAFHYEYQGKRGLMTIPGNAEVKGYANVAIAAAPIKNGESFTEANVRCSERELSKLIHAGYYPDWSKLKALTAVGYVRQDQVISSFFTQQPRSVAAGQWIDVIHERGALKVVARMKALEAGQRNQWIRAENPSSRKVMQVRVTGNGEAAIR